MRENKKSWWESFKYNTQLTFNVRASDYNREFKEFLFSSCTKPSKPLWRKNSLTMFHLPSIDVCHALNLLALTGLKCAAVQTSLVNIFELPVTTTISKALLRRNSQFFFMFKSLLFTLANVGPAL